MLLWTVTLDRQAVPAASCSGGQVACPSLSHPGARPPIRAEDLLVAQSLPPAPFGVVPGGVVVTQPHHSNATERSADLAAARICLNALEMALSGGRRPEIFHSDQGCQFTSSEFVARLQAEEISISWSGQKRCYDNIRGERLWRTVRYVAAGISAKPSRGRSACLQRWLGGGDQPCPLPVEVLPVRSHSALGIRTPHEVYTEAEFCASRPGLTMSGAKTVQYMAPPSGHGRRNPSKETLCGDPRRFCQETCTSAGPLHCQRT